MAQGSHSFTCHSHVYPRMEWAILHSFRKHSPDSVGRVRWRTSGSAYYSSIDPERMKGWVGLVGWPYSGWFTNISGHPSATCRSSVGQGMFDGQRPAFYHCATQPTRPQRSCSAHGEMRICLPASFTQYTVTITQVQEYVSDFNPESESHKKWGLRIPVCCCSWC